MIVQKDFLKKLRDFGLNTYESKLWTALLSRGISTAGELSDIANVPRSRSYDVLESLEKKGFIIMKLGKPIKYIAVKPEEVLERVKKKIKEDAEIQTNSMEELRNSEVLEELKLLHNQGVELVEPNDLTGTIKGRNNLYNHIESMIKTAEKTVSIATTTEGFIRKAEIFKTQFKKLKEKGVKIKIAAPLNTETSKSVDLLKDVAEIKHVDGLKARYCVVDGREIVFMLLDDKKVHPSYDTGIWVSTPFFASALEVQFNVAWQTMTPAQEVLKH
ncbi:TrmB family transcriptional regulator [Nanoarchaeota archaeon]